MITTTTTNHLFYNIPERALSISSLWIITSSNILAFTHTHTFFMSQLHMWKKVRKYFTMVEMIVKFFDTSTSRAQMIPQSMIYSKKYLKPKYLLCNLTFSSMANTCLNFKTIRLALSWRRALSNRNQSIELQSKSMDWCLYVGDLRHGRVTHEMAYSEAWHTCKMKLFGFHY